MPDLRRVDFPWLFYTVLWRYADFYVRQFSGMHLFMPLSDAIGMSLAEPERIGKRVGQFASIKIACSFAAGIAVFVGFRTGFFTFAGNSYPVFLVGSVFLALAVVPFVYSYILYKKAHVNTRGS